MSAFLPLLFHSCPLGKFLALKYHHQHQLQPKKVSSAPERWPPDQCQCQQRSGEWCHQSGRLPMSEIPHPIILHIIIIIIYSYLTLQCCIFEFHLVGSHPGACCHKSLVRRKSLGGEGIVVTSMGWAAVELWKKIRITSLTPIIFWTRKLFPVPAPPVKNTFRPDLTESRTYLTRSYQHMIHI